MTLIYSRLKTGDKVNLILPFVSSPIWELMSSFLSLVFNCFPLLLLNSDIESLKSAKYFGYIFYVGCCTKPSCVSVWRYVKNTFLNYILFFVSSVYNLELLHYFLFCLNIHINSLIFACNCIWCIDMTKASQHKHLYLICRVIEMQIGFMKLWLCLP